MDKSLYEQQVSLLVQTLPAVASKKCFALKGGTAINLFVRDMPRLSVDIDLVYLPINSRPEALAEANDALSQIVNKINKRPGTKAQLSRNRIEELRIIIHSKTARIKVELSPVLRGTLEPPIVKDVTPKVEERFGFASIKVVTNADLYGGKICATLDRQHPRDLFDTKLLLDSHELNRNVFDGFIGYLISHNRPISELLAPNWQPLDKSFETEFKGMTDEPISFEDLTKTRYNLIDRLKEHFTQKDYEFLLSFKYGEPDWNLATFTNIQSLPAVQWKLQNIRSMPKESHNQSIKKLEGTMQHYLQDKT